MKKLSSCFAVGLLIVAACYVATINAQVGKSLGVVDANIAPEKGSPDVSAHDAGHCERAC